MSAVSLFTESSISAINLFNKHAYQQSTYQQVTEGGRRQGRSLKIFAAPPQGEPGVCEYRLRLSGQILQILKLQGPRPCRRPRQKYVTFSMFFQAQKQIGLFSEKCFPRDPVESSKIAKSPSAHLCRTFLRALRAAIAKKVVPGHSLRPPHVPPAQ